MLDVIAKNESRTVLECEGRKGIVEEKEEEKSGVTNEEDTGGDGCGDDDENTLSWLDGELPGSDAGMPVRPPQTIDEILAEVVFRS
jgi:hypothetical protein